MHVRSLAAAAARTSRSGASRAGALARWTSALALALALAVPVAAQPSTLTLETRACKTPEATMSERAASNAAVDAWLAENPNARQEASIITIPVAWHILTNGSLGQVSQQQIDDQMAVLNDAFLPLGFQFVNAFQETVNNATWYFDNGTYWNSLALDTAEYLNIYTNTASGSLGYVPYLAGGAPEGTKSDRVVALWTSLPGGSEIFFNEGDTVVHEVGHWMGLAHTFQGGCGFFGDGVADTPGVFSPNYSCNENRDSCPSDGLGKDLVHNYMDYGDDPCMDSFTPGQNDRVIAQMNLHRPTIVANGQTSAPQASISAGPLTASLSGTETLTLPVTVTNLAASGAQDLTWVASYQRPTAPAGASASRWVTVSPRDGSAAAGTTAQIDVEFDATDQIDGVYTATLLIRTNDPATPNVTFPLSLTVSGNATGGTSTELGGTAASASLGAAEFSLAAPSPNPTRGAARVAFSLAEAGAARLTAVDALGREVAVLADGDLGAGPHTATFESANLPAGVYVLRLEAGGQVLVQNATVTR